MKTKTKTFFIIGLAAALCVGFLIGVSVDYPKTDLSNFAGTFGKADKYRNVQMTEKDIELRSSLMKDTALLKSTIQQLSYFSVFTEKVSAQIDLAILSFKAKGMGKESGEGEKLTALQDYSDFIKNNNKSLNTTIGMLAGFYANDPETVSVDVEKNLKDFGTYISKLNEKNVVLNQAFAGMDAFMINNKVLHAHQAELVQLKSIRDQLTISGIELAGMMCDKAQIGVLLEGIVFSQDNLIKLLGSDNLSASYTGTATETSKLQSLRKEDLNLVNGTQQLGTSFTGQEDFKGIGSIVYNAGALMFLKSDGQMSSLLNKTPGLDIIYIHSSGKLDVVLGSFGATDVMQSSLINGNFIRSNTLLQFMSAGNLQLVNASALNLLEWINSTINSLLN